MNEFYKPAVAVDDIETSPTVSLVNHRLHVVFPFFASAFQIHQLRLGALISNLSRSKRSQTETAAPPNLALGAEKGARTWVPPSVRPALVGRYASDKIWQPTSRSYQENLLPHVERLVAGRAPGLAQRYTLTDRVSQLLLKANLYEDTVSPDLRCTHQLFVPLSVRACQRIEAACGNTSLSGLTIAAGAANEDAPARGLFVNVQNVDLLHFRTGHALAVAEIQLARPDRGPLSAAELVEGSAGLARHAELGWVITKGPDTAEFVKGLSFTLDDVVTSFVNGQNRVFPRFRRAFTYSFATISGNDSPEFTRDLSTKLCRHYTDDYLLAGELSQLKFVEDFRSVLHAVTREGAATLVDLSSYGEPSKAPRALMDFYEARVRTAYLPILLVNLHELYEARAIASTTAFWPETGYDAAPRRWYWSVLPFVFERRWRKQQNAVMQEHLNRLDGARNRFLRLRLAFHFSEVSSLSPQNAFHEAFRHMLGVDRMASSLHDDVREINAHLAARIAQRTDEQVRKLRVLISAVLIGLVSIVLSHKAALIVTGSEELSYWTSIGLGFFAFLAAWRIRGAGQIERALGQVEEASEHVGHLPHLTP